MSKANAIKLAHDRYLAPLTVGVGAGVAANQFPQNQRSSKKARKKVEQVFKRSSDTEVFKSDNEFATKMYNLVMKMDEEEARWFTTMVVAEVLEDTIEKNQRTLQRHLNHVVDKQIDRAKKAIISKTARDGADDNAVAFAKALVEIEKANKNPYDTGAYRFQESDFNRDPSSGRFRTKIHFNEDKDPLKEKQATSLGIATPAEKLTGRAARQYQQEYLQIANFLNTVSQSGNLGDHRVHMLVRNRNGGHQHIVHLDRGMPKAGVDWDPKTERVVEVEARPHGLTMGGVGFGITNSFGHPIGRGGVDTLNRFDQHFPGFARAWNDDSDPYNSTSRLYSNVGSAGNFLANVASDGSKAQLAGAFAGLVGQHGSDAEKVFGPPIRRSAYRYRGVTKEPDQDLVRTYDAAINRAGVSRPTAEQTKARTTAFNRAVTQARKEKADRTKTPVDAVQLTRAERAHIMTSLPKDVQTAPSEEALGAGREVVHNYLTQHVNNLGRHLYGLHLDAGNTPPSEGVLIDKNGKIVSQAVGYGDDHYLPFNLKNLKSLRGGEYIRTRSVGGPTSEDIYTGLMAGAHRIQVVSRSGTFTVEFAGDFKGGRRYNDKAIRMVNRYQRILDSVQSETVDRQDVPPSIRRMITAKVNEEYDGWTPAERRQMVSRRLDEFKQNPDFDDAGLEREIDEFTRAMPEAERVRTRAQLSSDAKAAREFKFKLNGEGYEAALKALQEQFPYYIVDADHRPRYEEEKFESEKDKGYVEPGRLRPVHAASGYHGVKTALADHSGQKFSAADADYQQGKYGTGSRPRKGGRTTEVPTTAGGGTLEETGGKKASVRANIEENRNRDRVAPAALAMADEIRDGLRTLSEADQRQYSLLVKNPEDLKQELKNPAQVKKFDEQIEAFKKANPTFNFSDDVRRAYDNATARLDRKSYEHAAALLNPKRPFFFDEDAYSMDATKAQVDQEQEKLNRYEPASQKKKLGDMGDAELNTEIDLLAKIHNAAQGFRSEWTPDVKKDYLEREGLPSTGRPATLAGDPDALKKALKTVHRQKALNLNKGKGESKTKVTSVDEAKDETIHVAARQEGDETDYRARLTGAHDRFVRYRADLERRNKPIPDNLNNAIFDMNRTLEASGPINESDYLNHVEHKDYKDADRLMFKDMSDSDTARRNW